MKVKELIELLLKEDPEESISIDSGAGMITPAREVVFDEYAERLLIK
jgi:hypothetical protein